MHRITENVRLQDFADTLGLEIAHCGGREYIELCTVNVNRPGMQLAGYYDHFGSERVQIMGEMEMSYLQKLSDSERMESIDKFFSHAFPCLLLSTEIKPLPEMRECAEKYGRCILLSKKRTTIIYNDVVMYLNDLLAPNETRHGVLIDIYGVGVLLTGHSGVGKSETALELVQRGHRLIADDAVIMKRVNERIIGTAPAVIRYFMEVRGIGIVDVRNMYGVGAIKNSKVIEVVVELEEWDETKEYDRLGVTQVFAEILGMKLPKMTIPVKPGRNLAVILEVAARNHRLKSLGYSALDELDRRMNYNK